MQESCFASGVRVGISNFYYMVGLLCDCLQYYLIVSERELMFTFAICYRPSVCLSSVTLVRSSQTVQIFGNISTNGALGLDDVELLSAKQIRLTCRRVVLQVACVSVSVTFTTW